MGADSRTNRRRANGSVKKIPEKARKIMREQEWRVCSIGGKTGESAGQEVAGVMLDCINDTDDHIRLVGDQKDNNRAESMKHVVGLSLIVAVALIVVLAIAIYASHLI